MCFNGDFSHVRISSLFNSAGYLNKRRVIDILKHSPLNPRWLRSHHVSGFPRNKPSKISCLSIRLHDLTKQSKSKIAK